MKNVNQGGVWRSDKTRKLRASPFTRRSPSYQAQEGLVFEINVERFSKRVVEAAGVEPASENVASREPTCFFRSCAGVTRHFRRRAQNGQETQTPA